MTQQEIKEKLLNDNDFIHLIERGLYINKLRKKAFTDEVIADNNIEWIEEKISKNESSIYSDTILDPKVVNEIEKLLT